MSLADTGSSATGEERSGLGRRAGRVLVVLTVPFVVLGAVLTASLYGAFFGLPLLLVSWLPFRAGRRAVRNPDDLPTLKRLAWAAALAGTVLGAVVLVNLALGWDDLDALEEFASLIVGITWTIGFWWVAVQARRLVLAQ